MSRPCQSIVPGQVMVRMAASPINPSDLGFLKASYEARTLFRELVIPTLEANLK